MRGEACRHCGERIVLTRFSPHPTPADQNTAESSGSDLEAEVGRDE